jgi:hypothetical protein
VFDLRLSRDGSRIVHVQPLTAAGRSILPTEGILAWAHRRGWWIDPQHK